MCCATFLLHWNGCLLLCCRNVPTTRSINTAATRCRITAIRVSYVCHIAKLFFRWLQKTRYFFPMSETLSCDCRSNIIPVTCSKCCQVFEKASFPQPYGGNVSLVLQNKCYLGDTAETLPLRHKREVICVTWQKCSPVLKSEILVERRSRNTALALQEKCHLVPMAGVTSATYCLQK